MLPMIGMLMIGANTPTKRTIEPISPSICFVPIILVLAIISLILVLSKKFKGLWFTGLGSMTVMAFTFINFQMRMSDVKAKMNADLAGNPFRGLADMAMQSVQLQWGWALLIVGAALVISSAAIKEHIPVSEPITKTEPTVVSETEEKKIDT